MSKLTSVTVTNKASGHTAEMDLAALRDPVNSVIVLRVGPEEIASIQSKGSDLLITLKSGEVLTLAGFFAPAEDERNEVVLEDSGGLLWWGQYDTPWSEFAFAEINADELVAQDDSVGWWLLAALGGGALALGGGGGGGGGAAPTPSPALDTIAPEAPTARFNGIGDAVSGEAEPGSTVTVYDEDGNELGTATADEDGNYAVALDEPLTNGEEVEVTATDDAGNESDPTPAVAPDTTAPAAPTIALDNDTGADGADGITSDGCYTVGGTEAGARVEYSTDGTTWSTTAPTAAEGDNTIRVRQTDAAGNVSDAATLSFTLDTAAPNAPNVSIGDGDGFVSADELDTDGNVAVSIDLTGTNAVAGDTLKVNGVETVLTEAHISAGEVVTEIAAPAEGETLEVTATLTDAAGNTSAPGSASGVVDTTPPSITIEPSGGSEITGTAEAGSTVDVDVDGDGEPDYTTTADGDGNWSVTPETPLADGTEVSATATDDAGNTSAPATVTVDALAPEAPVITHAQDNVEPLTADLSSGDSTNDTTPTLMGTAEAGSTVTIFQGSTELGTATADGTGAWSFTVPTALAEDTYSFTATATDALGNASGASVAFELTVDTTAPTAGDNSIAFVDGGDELLSAAEATSVTLSGQVEAGATVESIVITDSATGSVTVAAADITVDGSGAVTVTGQDLSGLAQGTLTVTMTVSDAAGNSGSVSDTTALDRTGPSVTFDAITTDTGSAADFITSDSTLQFHGTVAPDDYASLSVTVGATTYVLGTDTQLTVDTAGNWNLDLTGYSLPVGSHAVTVSATDRAGNTTTTTPQNVSVVAFGAEDDAAALAMGEPTVLLHPTETTEDFQILGVTEADYGTITGTTLTVAEGQVGEVLIQVRQIALVAVADAFRVEIYDSEGTLVYRAVTPGNPLVGDVGGLDILGATGDDTLTARVTGLTPGAYTVVVRNDESVLDGLLDTNDDGSVSLDEVGDAGVLLGPENQEAVLGAVEDGLNAYLLAEGLDPGLGSGVRGLLEPLLGTVDGLGVGELVGAVSTVLNGLGLSAALDTVVGTLATTLLSNTLTAFQTTELTTALSEYGYAEGLRTVSGNVLDGDAVGGLADTVPDGSTVTQVTFGEGESAVEVDVPATGTVNIDGLHGVLTIAADGTYTYVAHGDRASIGQSEVFTYTVSDGAATDSATLTIQIAGEDIPAPVLAPDAGEIDMGAQSAVVYPPVGNDDVQVLGLAESTSGTSTSVPLTVREGWTGEILIEVSQTALVAVADAFVVEVLDALGNVVFTAATPDSPLVGDVAGLPVLGVTGDDTLVVTAAGLAPGSYTVVVRNDQSALTNLLDTDGGGITLTELGVGGVVLGPNNQALVLDALEAALNGALLAPFNLGLGSVVRSFILEPALALTEEIGVGDLVGTLSAGLEALGLSDLLDEVLDEVATTLLSNTLTLLQFTDITTTLTEYAFQGDLALSGNVLTGVGAGGDVADTVAAGGVVTQVANSDGDTAAVLGTGATGASLAGEYGTLVLHEDGSYTYTVNGARAALGQSEVFTYTVSDGFNTESTTLTIDIDGVGASGDIAFAGVAFDYLTGPGLAIDNAVVDGWVVALTPQTANSAPFTVAADTTQDLTLDLTLGNLLGAAGSTVVSLQQQQADSSWVTVASVDSSQLLGLLGLGSTGGEFLVPDVPEGVYRLSVTVSGVSVAGGYSIDLSSTVTYLEQYVQDGTSPTMGNLFDNDVVRTGSFELLVSADGTSFDSASDGATVAGQHGTLTVDADGSYTYTPNSMLTPADFAEPLSDSFSYQLVYDGGPTETAELTVFLRPSGYGSFGLLLDDGGLALVDVSGEYDVLGLDNGEADSLSLTSEEVIRLSSPDDTLVIEGNAGDTLNLDLAADAWVASGTESIAGQDYAKYAYVDTSATLFVDQDITVVDAT